MTTTTNPVLRAALGGLWWLVLIRGVLLLALGVLAFLAPDLTVVTLTLVFGAYAVVDGVVLIVNAIAARANHPGWGWLVGGGVLSVLAGLLVLTMPGFTGAVAVLAILWFIVVSAFVGGLLELVAARPAPRRRLGDRLRVLDAVLGLVLLVAVVFAPAAAALTLVWLFAIYAVAFGVVLIVFAFRLRTAASAAAR